MSRLLEVSDVSVSFGGVKALKSVAFDVAEGSLTSLIGPNGAGKTTLLRAITGVVSPQSANIRLNGRAIHHLPVHRRIAMGMAMTHQIVRPFKSMTLLDNVTLAAGYRRYRHPIRALVCVDRSAQCKRAAELLDLVGIGEHAAQGIEGQPLGVLKRLEVARALALDPRLLLLDEPLAGLNHVEARRLADAIVGINRRGLTVVMIEHNLGEVLRISGQLVVLDNGQKIAEGQPHEVMRSDRVRTAYIGREDEHAAS